MFTPPAALAGLAAHDQFVLVRLVAGEKKIQKLPCDWRTGATADAHDPKNWMSYAMGAAVVAARGDGWCLGFVFTKALDRWFLDIDGCLVDGRWSPLAVDLCTRLTGCAIEASISGTGLHIFGRGPIPDHSCRNQALGLEFYSEGRFVALGHSAIGDCNLQHPGIADVISQYFPPRAPAAVESSGDGNGLSDDEVLAKALTSTGNPFAAVKFRDLWEMNVPVLAARWPDTGGQGRDFDHSSADAAMASHLAFWSANNAEQIERIMRRSPLVRDKWDRADYLQRTITRAQAETGFIPKDTPTAPAASSPQGPFPGCIYVTAGHCALVPGSNRPLTPQQFDVRFGGQLWPLDDANTKTTRKAWEAFTQSMTHRPVIVDSLAFRPDRAPGEVIEETGVRSVNVWTPAQIERTPGDATPFLNHLAKLLPDPSDRQMLLSYMAALVQHQGTKFTWAPLIQGVEGNGKSALTTCIQNAVGLQYLYIPRADQISAKFNSWLWGVTVVAVEDVFVVHQRQEVLEVLKPMITLRRQSIERKGIDQAMTDVVANFLFNSNHKSGLRKTQNDRRIAPFFCAQQRVGDLVRDGLTADYFDGWWNWYNDGGGRAVVNDFLWTYPIPRGTNPAIDCPRAPITSSTQEALAQGMGFLEQEVLEAIEQHMPGFRGGWVSSIQLRNLLERLHSRPTQATMEAMIEDMGFTKVGRTLNIVSPDMGRPVLYFKGPALPITLAELAYQKAQA